MNTTTLETKVNDFLAQKRIAIAGVSRHNNHHPAGNLIYKRLKKTGHDVFPVNPNMQTRECHRAIGAHRIPGPRCRLGCSRGHSSFPFSGAAGWTDGLT